MSYANEIGRIGERMTADFLRKNGYIIVAQNYHTKYGELDIVTENPSELVFVEVKTRRHGSIVAPADAVDNAKQRKLAISAEIFAKRLHHTGSYRFDIAEVVYKKSEDGLFSFSLNYIKNAFVADIAQTC